MQYIEKIKNSPLFKNIEPHDIEAAIKCLNGKIEKFEKNKIVIQAEKLSKNFGLLIDGKIQIAQYDYFGNKSIISIVEPMQIFGEAFSCIGIKSSINVETVEESVTLFLNSEKLRNPCNNNCLFHKRLINNLLYILSQKNINLTQKIECMAKRTTKEKLLTFLSIEARKNNNNEFNISFDRQALADYLGIDRSAMSTEISKLRQLGIIETKKNMFKLLNYNL